MKSILLALAFAVAASPFSFDPQDDSGKVVGTWKSLDKENGQPSAEVTVKKAEDLNGGHFFKLLPKA